MPLRQDRSITSHFPQQIVPKITFPEWVLPGLNAVRERICETEFLTGRQETYGSVLDKSRRIARFLLKNGLRSGGRVGVYCDNALEYTQVVFGIIRAGCTVVAVSGESFRDVERGILETKPAFVFTDCAKSNVLLEATEGKDFCKGVVVFGTASGCIPLNQILEEGEDQDLEELETFSLNPQESLLILYTSGATGPPKGVQITHENFISCKLLDTCLTNQKRKDRTVLVHCSPVHMSGAFARLNNLYNREHIILLPSLIPDHLFKAISRYKIQEILLTPGDVWTLLNETEATNDDVGLASLKTVFISGGSTPFKIRQELREKFKLDDVLNMYEQVESLRSFLPCNLLDSFGILLPNIKAKVINSETRQPQLPFGIGELFLKGPTVMKGYLDDVDKLKGFTDDGWFPTGDLVYYDDKERFYFVERSQDIIHFQNQKLSPYDIEEVLYQHPSVKEVLVVGVFHSEFGEIARAHVVLKEPCAEEDLKVLAENKMYLRGCLSVRVEDALPKSGCGKQLRRVLRGKYNDNLM